MSRSRKLRAESKFARTQKTAKTPHSERAEEERIAREKTAKLRALRLAKEEADRAAAARNVGAKTRAT